MKKLSQKDLVFLASLGAEARVRELRAEIETILGSFPNLRSGSRSAAPTASKAGKPHKARRQPKWTAAQRAAAAKRMKAYWAKRKAGK